MAGDWIKMRADLLTSPKVVRMASALRADRFRVIGGLHAVWCLFDVHSEDGTLNGYSLKTLDGLIGWSGFGKAMAAVDWLTVSDDFLAVPRFDEHNGQSAKRRAQEAFRKRLQRSETSASDADTMRTREEKSRGEKRKDSPGKAPGAKSTIDPVKDEIWKTGRGILEGQGDSRENAGSFLGKLIGDYGKKLVIEAVRDCDEQQPLEAKAWLMARCQERRAQSGNKSSAIETRNRQAAEAALREAGHG